MARTCSAIGSDNVPLGDVRGFDVRTGRQAWVFKTIPQAGEFGNDTWGEESWKWMGNTNVWSMMSCDPELGIVYLPVTAPSSHFYGGLRPGNNLFGTSVVALGLPQWASASGTSKPCITTSGTTIFPRRRWWPTSS